MADSAYFSNSSLIYYIYAVAFLDLFAASMITTCFATYLTDELEMSATSAGIIGSVYGFVQFFSSPVVGSWSDSYGYKIILSACLLFCVPAYALLTSSIWIFVILGRFLAGSFKHTQTLCRTYLATFATDMEKMEAYGKLNAMGNVGFVLGPAVEAWLIRHYGYGSVFWFVSFVFFCNAIFVLTVFPGNSTVAPSSKEPKPSKNFSPTSAWTTFTESLEKVNWHRQWDLMLTRFLLSFSVLLYRSSYTWMMQDKFHVDASTIGYLTSYQGVVSFCASICTSYFAYMYDGDTARYYEHVIIMMLIALIGLLMAGSLFTYAIFLLPFCASTSIMRVITLQLTTERSEKSDIGLVLGVSASTVSVGRMLSPAMGGMLHDCHRDATAIFCILMVIVSWIVTNVYTRFYNRHFKTVKHSDS